MNIISVHFPKAGGHSLFMQLLCLLGDSLLADYDHDPLGPNAVQTVAALPPGTRMVHGHFRAARYAKVGNAFRFTFLRHPVDNLLSIFFYWLALPEATNAWHEKTLEARPTIEEFAQYAPIQRLMSDTYFGGYDMSRFDLVGFSETRSADYRKLGNMIGLPIDPSIHLNQTEGDREQRARITSDAGLMRRLSALLSDDIRFYEKQRKIWS